MINVVVLTDLEEVHHPDKYCILGANPNLKRLLMNERLDPSDEASRISIIITKWKYVRTKMMEIC
ncbi:BZ3500_MvSof-1268-A1-R1_Chr1-1g01153 [Microbotryum saponariae]|uniref:BZ3500_MvSof-1268-A1-R1_Chr1-1g01153 protein n=1 Tax=Microbotryum saponariae TaxID=289078 RepID=A0A2X0MDW5_9BASI|nr:BZ3500_MvSof-1268-A1-R1_Chr1-1g01153 [Microbotryum saponariae]SCZ93518.1 BZ3501_MvSof-1269-A2-R1_Chr1-1g00750 [Microbotryum saponariae]